MRGQARFACLALLLAVLGAADGDAAGDEAAKGGESGADSDDFDFDDLDSEEGGQEAGGEAQPMQDEASAVEDFDLGMPEEDRKQRMNSCFYYTMNRVRTRGEQLQATLKEAMSQQPQLSQEQILNTMVFTWMMTCYMNIDSDGIRQATQTQQLTQELEVALFSEREDTPQQIRQASRRQWQLIEETLMERQQEQKQQQQQQHQDSPKKKSSGAKLPLTGMSGQSQVLYILVVFGVVFGLGAIVTYRLINAEKAGREKPTSSAKSQKKADKAEKKLAKKKM